MTIKFYIPKGETIPTDLRLQVDDTRVDYERIKNGFRFHISTMDECKAMEVAQKIVERMKLEHDEPEHGISWRTVSLEIVPQDPRYEISTLVDWVYRVRDSY